MDLSKGKHTVFALTTGTLILVALLLLLDGVSGVARATAIGSLFVAPDGTGSACSAANPCALQTALSQAKESDAIYVAQGTYAGSGLAVISITKSIALYGGWDRTTTTPPLCDPTVHPTTLDGGGARRVIYVGEGTSPTIDGFIITNGNANDAADDPAKGGGIYSKDASPIVRNNVIVGNAASMSPTTGSGGGIYLWNASELSLISENQVLSNTAHSDSWGAGGGGIYLAHSDVTIVGNLIQGNTCNRAGGAMYIGSGGEPRVRDNQIRSNRSDSNGAGIYARFRSLPHIEGNLVIDNVAASFGGGVCCVNGCQPTIVANRVFTNTAKLGAGVLLETSAYFTVTNNFVAYNGDGGIHIWDMTRYGLVAHNTVAFNGGAEGGIYLAHEYITPTVLSNIVVSNTYGIRAHYDASGTLDFNDVWANTIQDYDLPGALEPGPHDIQADPLFVAPSSGGFHLQAGSPCIDAGTDAGVTSDIDGDSRPFGAGYDIGADEFKGRVEVYLPLVQKRY